jgi:hypothetical protein
VWTTAQPGKPHPRDLGPSCRSVHCSKEREGSPTPDLRLPQAKLSRNLNQVARGRIRRFESCIPSHAVGLRRGRPGVRYDRHAVRAVRVEPSKKLGLTQKYAGRTAPSLPVHPAKNSAPPRLKGRGACCAAGFQSSQCRLRPQPQWRLMALGMAVFWPRAVTAALFLGVRGWFLLRNGWLEVRW